MTAEIGKPQAVDLCVPPVLETAQYFQQALSKYFAEVSVEVTACPDLREEPYGLVGAGLGGSPFIVQAGGVKYLFPCPRSEKVYDLRSVAQACELPTVNLIGAGGGPLQAIGCNSEAVINFQQDSVNKSVVCNNYIARWGLDGKDECVASDEPQCSYLGDMYGSQGLPGEVMRFRLKRRLGEKGANLLALLRSLLTERFGTTDSIGMGGALLLKNGKAKLHILERELGKGPLEMRQLFSCYDAQAPLIGAGMLLTNDCGIGMNVSHVHMFNREGHGGHYEEDVTPDEVEYEAYFAFAKRAVHFDAPQ